jgi:hypothetical protein
VEGGNKPEILDGLHAQDETGAKSNANSRSVSFSIHRPTTKVQAAVLLESLGTSGQGSLAHRLLTL